MLKGIIFHMTIKSNHIKALSRKQTLLWRRVLHPQTYNCIPPLLIVCVCVCVLEPSCVVLCVSQSTQGACQLLVVSALFLTFSFVLCCPVTFPEDQGTEDKRQSQTTLNSKKENVLQEILMETSLIYFAEHHKLLYTSLFAASKREAAIQHTAMLPTVHSVEFTFQMSKLVCS